MKTQLLKSISRLLFLAFATSISVAQNIEYENLIDTKWKLTNYIIDGQSFPTEKKRKKDYYIFKNLKIKKK